MKRLIVMFVGTCLFALTAAAQTRISPYRPEFLDKELLTAVTQNDAQNVERLIKLGANVNATTDDDVRDTALSLAIMEGGYPEIVKLLVENGADVNAKDTVGASPLLMAVYWHNDRLGINMEIVRLLIQHGADVNAQDCDGMTALMYAAKVGHAELARVLVTKGADITLKNKERKTAISLAKSAGHPEVAGVIAQVYRQIQSAKVAAVVAQVKYGLSK